MLGTVPIGYYQRYALYIPYSAIINDAFSKSVTRIRALIIDDPEQNFGMFFGYRIQSCRLGNIYGFGFFGQHGYAFFDQPDGYGHVRIMRYGYHRGVDRNRLQTLVQIGEARHFMPCGKRRQSLWIGIDHGNQSCAGDSFFIQVVGMARTHSANADHDIIFHCFFKNSYAFRG